MSSDDAARVTSSPVRVSVDLGPRSYDILIGRGLIASAGRRSAAASPARGAAIVTDETVAAHLEAMADSLRIAASITAASPCRRASDRKASRSWKRSSTR